ncbi:L-rhamnono-gamma-lactonase [Hondaea fermentalgiana]|uniref:L-rhamnono-gamma-lactonase n=1 Tax=Hondaea fermentalgiana TaxID=2315210 RepID=A0A2R5GI53_9STRA|nr:L-rhamnono-gamma-lactonase [Hondaea fermentalgiana]|eukprot:GBG30576.1 L-rhamnono-gamma-lactonase [Hondaea fermentalgiana]
MTTRAEPVEVDPFAEENQLQPWLDKGAQLSDSDLKELGLDTQRIIDPHHHLFNFVDGGISTAPDASKGSEESGKDESKKNPLPALFYETFGRRLQVSVPYEAKALNKDINRLNVRGTVFIECGSYYDMEAPEHLRSVGETVKVNEIAKSCPIIGNQIRVPSMAMEESKLEEVLDAHAKASTIVKLTGVRDPVAKIDPRMQGKVRTAMDHNIPYEHLASDEYARGAKVLERRGLTLDLYLFYHQLPMAAQLARKVPNLRLVIDHCGGLIGDQEYAKPEVQQQMREEWEKSIEELASIPNVRIKLGGILMSYCGLGFDEKETAPSAQEVADAQYPWMSFIIDKFGVDRCIFESNFPMDRVSVSYENCFASFMLIAKRYGCSAEDIDKMFYSNAVETYQLNVPETPNKL